MTRILACHPGPQLAVSDIYDGLRPALERAGVRVDPYALDVRLDRARTWLASMWRAVKDTMPRPTTADILFEASHRIIVDALWNEVDWVLLISGLWFHPQMLLLLKRAGIRTAVLCTEAPQDDPAQMLVAREATVSWVNERTSVEKYRTAGIDCHYYQHAIDPARHAVEMNSDAADVPAHDVVFVGTGWEERCDLLSAVDWTGIDLGLYGSWGLLASRSRLRQYLRGGAVPNAQTAALYRKAKIGLNLHRTAVTWGRGVEHISGESMNPRGYELGACGLFHVSDYRPEVAEVYGGLIPTFETPGELEALIRRYLADDDDRQRIAAQLPACVAAHTFDTRARQMLRVLGEMI